MLYSPRYFDTVACFRGSLLIWIQHFYLLEKKITEKITGKEIIVQANMPNLGIDMFVCNLLRSYCCELGGLCIVYFKWYDTYRDTHEAILMVHFVWFLTNETLYIHKVGYFNDQNILNLSKNVSFEVLCN